MALDCEEPQVLVRFVDDQIQWHHRVLIRRLSAAIWIALTPDGELQVIDLSEYDILPLARGGNIPAQAGGDTYLFGGPLGAELSGYHAAATRMASVLGATTSTAVGSAAAASWRVADTAAVEFGTEVAADLVTSAASGVVKGSVGLCRCGEPAQWLFVELVPTGEFAAWEADKRSGAGRDPRLAPAEVTTNPTVRPLSELVSNLKPVDTAKMSRPWPHEGPRAIMEVLTSILGLGLVLTTYSPYWAREAGIHLEATLAWEHKIICHALSLVLGYDGLDISNLASAEYLSRRLIQIERAVRVDPKAPSFVGLAGMIRYAQDERGGLATREFTNHMAQQAESEARILK